MAIIMNSLYLHPVIFCPALLFNKYYSITPCMCLSYSSLRSGLWFSNWSMFHSHLRVSDSVDLEWGPQVCTCNAFPEESNAAGLGPIWEPLSPFLCVFPFLFPILLTMMLIIWLKCPLTCEFFLGFYFTETVRCSQISMCKDHLEHLLTQQVSDWTQEH